MGVSQGRVGASGSLGSGEASSHRDHREASVHQVLKPHSDDMHILRACGAGCTSAFYSDWSLLRSACAAMGKEGSHRALVAARRSVSEFSCLRQSTVSLCYSTADPSPVFNLLHTGSPQISAHVVQPPSPSADKTHVPSKSIIRAFSEKWTNAMPSR